mmetsp:Transcript_20334/g.36315  ORF Transcript_20334/g.36315 Transcript_20334/m.36315 type:complete len:88 (-) Transcript_20334:170-433(-)
MRVHFREVWNGGLGDPDACSSINHRTRMWRFRGYPRRLSGARRMGRGLLLRRGGASHRTDFLSLGMYLNSIGTAALSHASCGFPVFT